MKGLLLYVAWIFFSCLLLTLGGLVLDIYNPRPSEFAGYFEMYLAPVGLPTWLQNIFILVFINGFAAIFMTDVRILFKKDFRMELFPFKLIGINLIAVIMILSVFVVIRASI